MSCSVAISCRYREIICHCGILEMVCCYDIFSEKRTLGGYVGDEHFKLFAMADNFTGIDRCHKSVSVYTLKSVSSMSLH